MGKLGGGELNVSSDIDLIFIYRKTARAEGGTRHISNHEYASPAGQKLIALSEPPAAALCFVDQCTAPARNSGPLVMKLRRWKTTCSQPRAAGGTLRLDQGQERCAATPRG